MARSLLLMFSMRLSWRCSPVALVLTLVAVTPAPSAAPVPASSTAASRGGRQGPALDEFSRAVDAYRRLRKKEEARIGPLPESSDPAAITRRQHALGEAIRLARPTARQGDIFTPEVARMLKRIIAHDLRKRQPVDRQAFIVSQPDTTVHVNDFYPTTVPLATVPPRLLAELPQLPDGLEYRFVSGALILRDVDPNLVVDVLPNAVPAAQKQ